MQLMPARHAAVCRLRCDEAMASFGHTVEMIQSASCDQSTTTYCAY